MLTTDNRKRKREEEVEAQTDNTTAPEEAKPTPEQTPSPQLAQDPYVDWGDSDIEIEIDLDPTPSDEDVIPETQELPEDKGERHIQFVDRHSRFVTETGISSNTQTSALSATPTTQEEKDYVKPPLRRRRSSTTTPSAFFSSSSSSPTVEKKTAIDTFRLKQIDIAAIQKKFLEVIDNFMTAIFDNSSMIEKRAFIGRFFYILAQEYHGNTLPLICAAETNNPKGEHSINRLKYFLLCQAQAYDNDDGKRKLVTFRQQNLSTYQMIQSSKYPISLRPVVATLQSSLETRKPAYYQLIDAEKATMEQMNLFVDGKTKTTTEKSLLDNGPLKEHFKHLMSQHLKHIISYYPTTAGHHIALLAYKMVAIFMNARGVKLPTQHPSVSDVAVFTQDVTKPFLMIAADAGYEEAVKRVDVLNARAGNSLTR